MEKQFDQWELNTPEDHNINSLIMSQASDTAEKMTELECKLLGIECWIGDEEDGFRFDDEAQEIFDVIYEQQCEELYGLLNAQLKEIEKS